MISHLLNRRYDVYRATTTTDDGGGREVTRAKVGTVKGRPSNPTPSERQVAARQENETDRDVYLNPGADVRRGDELRRDRVTLWVDAVVEPSERVYRKAECIQRHHEGS